MEQVRLLLGNPDAKVRSQGLEHLSSLVDYLQRNPDEPSVIACIKLVRDVIKGNNAKMTQMALKLLRDIVLKVGVASRNYFDLVCEAVIDRLGDNKPFVRQEAIALYMQFIESMGDRQLAWNCLQQQSLQTKNGHVRHSALVCYQQSVARFGLNFIPLTLAIPYILSLLDDQLPIVREECLPCLLEIYRHTGPDFALYLTQNAGLRPAHLKAIQQLFEKTDLVPEGTRIQIDWSRLPMKSSGNALPSKPSTEDVGGSQELGSDITPVLVTTESDLEVEIDLIVDTIKDSKSHWQDRVSALRKLGGLALGPARKLPNLISQLRRCLQGMIVQVNELRSAVAKETCTVVALLSRTLGTEFSPITDAILPELLRLTISSIQVVADTADQCIRVILRHSRIQSVIRKIIDFSRGKNPALRATATEYLALLLASAPTDTLDRFCEAILDQIRYSLTDANENARVAARTCYWALRSHWPQRAQQLYDSLDTGVQKTLMQSDPEKMMPRATSKSRRRSKPFPVSVGSAVKEDDIEKEQRDPNWQSTLENPDALESASSRSSTQRYLPSVGGAVRVIRPSTEDHTNRHTCSEIRAQVTEGRNRSPTERCSNGRLSSNVSGERVAIDSVDVALTLCNSKDWNDRFEAFEYILNDVQILKGVDRSHILDIFRSHINDRNLKVSIACLTSLVSFLSNSESVVNQRDVSLLQALMFAQLDTKEQVRNPAVDALQLLYRSCAIEDLMSELMQIAQSQMMKLQDLALQAVINISELRRSDMKQHFKSSEHIQFCLTKLQPLLSIRRPVLLQYICDILQLMAASAPDLFKRHVMQLSSSDQASVAKMVSVSSSVEDVQSTSKKEAEPQSHTESAPIARDESCSHDNHTAESLSDETAIVQLSTENATYYKRCDSDDKNWLPSLTEELNRPYLTQKKILRTLREVSVHLSDDVVTCDIVAVKNLLEAILRILVKFSSHHEIHVDISYILHMLLTKESIRNLIRPCYAIVFNCLFGLQQVDRVSVFEAAADILDFADCVSVIESKLSNLGTPRTDLVTTIELISYSFLSNSREPALLKRSLDRLIPLFVPLLKHKEIDVRKACVFCIIDLYSELDRDYMSALWPLLEPVQFKLLRVFIDKRGLPVPPLVV